METEKSPKRSLRKIFRNVWLYSLILFIVGLIGFRFLGWEAGFSRTATIVIMGASALVGGISFLTWISILIFSNKFSRIIIILLGIFISSLYALTIYSVTYIFVYSRVSQGSMDTLVDLQYILPLLIFGLTLGVWLKTKPLLIKGIVIAGLLVTYLAGRNYAVEAYKPLTQAFNFIDRANSTEGLAWTNEPDDNKYLEGERKYVALYKQASESIKNDVFRSWPRQYFNDLYRVEKKVLDYDEQLFTGKLKISQEEIDKITAEVMKERSDILASGFSTPYWTEFFMVVK
ncbi:MAG: hypothetical protein WA052_02370 [Microgenomates group bacterium]